MPAVVVAELGYDKTNNQFFVDLFEFLNKLLFIKDGQRIYGKLEFCYIDKKVKREVSKSVELWIRTNRGIFEFGSEEIIKKFGITPGSWICLVLEEYSEKWDEDRRYPIYPDYFEIITVPDALRGEIESRFTGAEEVLKLIELTGIAENLEEAYGHLKNAYVKFKSDFFEDAKTSSRKTLEILRGVVQSWKTVDISEHLADGIKSLVRSLYSFSSTGGPHPGIATRDETEVILNSLLYLFKYINKILTEGRAETSTQVQET